MLPLTEGDDEIERALQDAHLPTLLAALVHLTGDLSLVREAGQLVFGYMGDYQGKLAPELQARIRAAALDALKRYRDAGRPDVAAPPVAVVSELMRFVGAQPVPDHYLPFLLEELGLSARDSRVPLPHATHDGFDVLVIGAGMSGIAAGVRLQQAGIPFAIVEKNADVGGTWLENSYPGCRVDSPNHAYSYSFEPNYDWPQHYSTQDVLLRYFREVADKHALRKHIRFSCAVIEARWDEAACLWRVRVRDASGREETLSANALISAVGQLNRPRYPDIPGQERFEGPAFHSARWDHSVDLRGKRVAVIGTGASAFQFIPEIAPRVAELRIFQRTPPWVLPTPNYHEDIPVGLRWLLARVPAYEKWYRFWLFWLSADGLRPYVTADPNWQGPPNTLGHNHALMSQMVSMYIRAQLKDRPDLLTSALPSYPAGGKRMLRDNGTWYAALKRDNVRVITDSIVAIEATGVRTADGIEHSADVLIFGTGFQANDFLQPMAIYGRDGRDLRKDWNGDARAHLGITVPGFPNLFLIYGPNTNIVVNGSIIFFTECAVRYALGCVELLRERGHRALEVKQQVHDEYNVKVDEENARMAWGAPGVSSWYKNATGRVSQNWPFALIDYWQATLAPAPDEFRIW